MPAVPSCHGHAIKATPKLLCPIVVPDGYVRLSVGGGVVQPPALLVSFAPARRYATDYCFFGYPDADVFNCVLHLRIMLRIEVCT
jgi:hypothetical protein